MSQTIEKGLCEILYYLGITELFLHLFRSLKALELYFQPYEIYAGYAAIACLPATPLFFFFFFFLGCLINLDQSIVIVYYFGILY